MGVQAKTQDRTPDQDRVANPPNLPGLAPRHSPEISPAVPGAPCPLSRALA